jgi:hypothetical protein
MSVSVSNLTAACFFTFGLSSWLLCNALFAELALLMPNLPEGFQLASYIALCIQLAGVAPLVYAALVPPQDTPDISAVHVVPSDSSLPRTRPLSSCAACMNSFIPPLAVLIINAVLPFITALTWDKTSSLFGEQHSTALLLMALLTGIASCSSSVIYWPYVSRYDPACTTYLSTGEASSSILLAIICAIQNPSSSTPVFSVFVYFMITAFIAVLSLGAFLAIHFTSIGADVLRVNNNNNSTSPQPLSQLDITYTHLSNDESSVESVQITSSLVVSALWPQLLSQGIRAFVNYGVMNSLFSIACSRYPSSRALLQWSGIVGNLIAPLASYSTKWIKAYRRLHAITFVCFVVCALIVFISIQPILSDSTVASWIMIIVLSTTFTAISTYSGTLIFLAIQDSSALPELQQLYARMSPHQHQLFVESGSRASGVSIQVGALLGSVISFLLLRYTSWWPQD